MTDVIQTDVQTQSRRWRALARVHAAVESAVERELQSELDLSLTEYRALDLLAAGGMELRMQTLAQDVGLSRSATTRLVGRLENRGFVFRDVCEIDGRGVNADLTAAGREILDLGRPVHDRVLGAVLKDLVDTDDVQESRDLFGEALKDRTQPAD